MNTTISKQTLSNLLVDSGIDTSVFAPRLLDDQYALPKLSWIKGRGGLYIRADVLERVGEYTKNTADCDDYARCAAERVREIHRKTTNAPKGAIAFGVCEYFRDVDRGTMTHYINVFAYRDDDLRLAYFEPYPHSCCVVKLSRSEVASICYIEV